MSETNDKIIGKVSATEKNPSTIDYFYFWTDSQSDTLSPFDVVSVTNGNNGTTTYAVVEEINHVTDSASHFASYISSEFGSLANVKGISSGNTNRLQFSFVKAKVVHNTGDKYTPVLHDSPVSLCTADQIREALGLKNVKNPLTCGYMEMYGEKVKVDINDKFLIGPDGAHLNVSGISGLACKTSYTMFLLNALQQKYIKVYEQEVDDEVDKPRKIAFLIFNVKGRDLLTLDIPNDKLDDENKRIYEKELGLKPTAFQQVSYYYPYGEKKERQCTQSNADWDDMSRQFNDEKNAKRYFYNFENCRDKLQYLFANEPDPSGTLESIIAHIIDCNHPFTEHVQSWSEFYNILDNGIKTKKLATDAISLPSWKKFARIVRKFKSEALFSDKGYDHNDTSDLVEDIFANLHHNDVKVIDIAQLDPAIQGFVFGDVIQQVVDRMSAKDSDSPDQIVIFVDELNKYASTDVPKSSPILRHLLDVAERGRALGIILFSVEQFRSAIHDRVKGNCANSAYGRTNFVEVTKPDYMFFGNIYKNMMTRLSPGDYIINNPALRSLVKIKFPYPTFKSNN